MKKVYLFLLLSAPSFASGASIGNTNIITLQNNIINNMDSFKKIIDYLYNLSRKSSEKIKEITGKSWDDDKISQFKEGINWLWGCAHNADQNQSNQGSSGGKSKKIDYCINMPASMKDTNGLFGTGEWLLWMYDNKPDIAPASNAVSMG